MVNIWSVAAAGLTKAQTIDLTTPQIKSMNPMPTSVCMNA